MFNFCSLNASDYVGQKYHLINVLKLGKSKAVLARDYNLGSNCQKYDLVTSNRESFS